jgi:uncharacterized RDD family membrane protein YckC
MTIKRANFGARVGALAIDVVGVVVFAIIFNRLIFKAVDALGMVKFLSIDTSAEAIMIIILELWGAALLYMLIEAFAAATPGKMLLGMKIAAENGQRAKAVNLLLRYILKNSFFLIVLPFGIVEDMILSILFLAIGLAVFVGFFLVLGEKKQALHDLISKTAVFRRTRPHP